MVMYKVKDKKTGLYKSRKGIWPDWGDEGTLFLTKGAAKCSVSYNPDKNEYEIIGYEVTLKEVSNEIYKGI